MHSTLKKVFLAFMVCGWATNVFAQEELLENFLQTDEENNEAAETWLQELLSTPLDLNQVDATELHRLPFLSHTQITAFLAHRQREVYYPNLEQALFALQVTGDTLKFCYAIFTVTLPKALQAGTTWDLRLRSRTGVPATIEENWIGSRYRQYHRLQFEHGDFHGGALFERDPGERRWDDHRAASIMWRHANGRVILGNFQTEWGLGLAQWSPYAATLAADVHAATRRWGRGVTPFISSNESRAYEGAALSQLWRRWEMRLYLSTILRDVTLSANQRAVSYRTSGYHRTAGERAQRDNLREQSAGAALLHRFGIGREIGVLFQSERFNRAWQRDNARESFFDFTGTRNALVSFAGRWQWAKHALSFEVAQSRSRGQAAAIAFFQQEGFASWTIALFHADRDYHSVHGRSLFASDEPAQGQAGYSFGLKLRPQQHMNVEFYYQREQNLWRTRALPLPPRAALAGLSVRWRIADELRLLLRYTNSNSENLVQESAQFIQTGAAMSRYRCEFEHRLSSRLRLKPRLEVVRRHEKSFAATTPNRLGTAVSLEVEHTFSFGLLLSFKQTHFRTPHAIYQYERDLPGVFTVVALRENGFRRYIYGHLKLHPNFGLAGKISANESDGVAAPERSRFAWAVQLDWTRR